MCDLEVGTNLPTQPSGPTSRPTSRRRTWAVTSAVTAVAAAAALVLAAAGCGSAGGPAAAAAGQVPRPANAGVTPGPIRLVGTEKADGAMCGDYRVPVTLGEQPLTLATSTFLLAVRLCARGRFAGRTVELLLAGAGYDSRVFTLGPDWVRRATAAGLATAQVDLLGTGASDHPAGAALTYAVQAWTVHMVAQDLASSTLFGASFARVVLVGHSVGGYVAWDAAGRWPADIAGVVLVDAAHTRRAEQVARIQAAQHPTAGDPRFAGMPWAGDGYVALAPGSRCGLFYYDHGYDPAVCRDDEATFAHEGIPTGELTGLTDITSSPVTRDVHAPVLLVLGDHDPLLCGPAGCAATDAPVRAECATWYPNAASCGFAYVADAGHDSFLHRQAPAAQERVTGWIRQVVQDGQDGPR